MTSFRQLNSGLEIVGADQNTSATRPSAGVFHSSRMIPSLICTYHCCRTVDLKLIEFFTQVTSSPDSKHALAALLNYQSQTPIDLGGWVGRRRSISSVGSAADRLKLGAQDDPHNNLRRPLEKIDLAVSTVRKLFERAFEQNLEE